MTRRRALGAAHLATVLAGSYLLCLISRAVGLAAGLGGAA